MSKAKRELKLINLKPAAASKIKDAREGSKIALLIKHLEKSGGVTLQELSKAMSRKGSKVSPSYVKAWMNYDLHKLHGLGVKSTRDDDGKVRCFLVRPTVRKPKPVVDNVVPISDAKAA